MLKSLLTFTRTQNPPVELRRSYQMKFKLAGRANHDIFWRFFFCKTQLEQFKKMSLFFQVSISISILSIRNNTRQ